MSLFKQKDSQNERRWQWLTDQHGRAWGCTIELSTGDPTGPIDLYNEKNGRPMRAPVMPPVKFLKVDSKKAHGELHVDYRGWKAEIQRAWSEYNRRMLGYATQMYKDDAAQKVDDPPPALLAAVGLPPQKIEPVEAAEYGDPWALGLTDVRPDWADLFMAPEHTIVKRAERKGRPAFLDYKKEAEDNPGRADETQAPATAESYPLFVKSAGRGVSAWKLSDGSEFIGKKEDAIGAEAAVDPHPSWSDA